MELCSPRRSIATLLEPERNPETKTIRKNSATDTVRAVNGKTKESLPAKGSAPRERQCNKWEVSVRGREPANYWFRVKFGQKTMTEIQLRSPVDSLLRCSAWLCERAESWRSSRQDCGGSVELRGSEFSRIVARLEAIDAAAMSLYAIAWNRLRRRTMMKSLRIVANFTAPEVADDSLNRFFADRLPLRT